jgi:hypothetical protein
MERIMNYWSHIDSAKLGHIFGVLAVEVLHAQVQKLVSTEAVAGRFVSRRAIRSFFAVSYCADSPILFYFYGGQRLGLEQN